MCHLLLRPTTIVTFTHVLSQVWIDNHLLYYNPTLPFTPLTLPDCHRIRSHSATHPHYVLSFRWFPLHSFSVWFHAVDTMQFCFSSTLTYVAFWSLKFVISGHSTPRCCFDDDDIYFWMYTCLVTWLWIWRLEMMTHSWGQVNCLPIFSYPTQMASSCVSFPHKPLQ